MTTFTLGVPVSADLDLGVIPDSPERLAMLVAEREKLAGIAAGAQVNPADLDGVPDSTSRIAMTPAERSKLAGVANGADVTPANLDGIPDSASRLAMLPAERTKLASVQTGAQVNPTDLDGVPDSANRLALQPTERSKLAGIQAGAQVNPASLDALADGSSRIAFSPAQQAKLAGIQTGAQVNPTDLDGVPDSATRVAFTPAERAALASLVAAGGTAAGDDALRNRFAYMGGAAPQVYVRFRNVRDLTKDFGANNLVMDADEMGNGTEELDKMTAIRAAVTSQFPTGNVDIVAPRGRLARMRSIICWPLDNTIFAGNYGFVNTSTNSSNRLACATFGWSSISASEWYAPNNLSKLRLLATSDLRIGTQDITLPVQADYDAIVDGDRAVMLNDYCTMDTVNGQTNPGKLHVTEMHKTGNRTVHLTDPLPFDLTTETNPDFNSGLIPWVRADGSALNGPVFGLLREATPPGWVSVYTPGGKGFMARGCEMHGLTLISQNGHLFMGFPLEGVFNGCRMSAEGIWYGNTAIGCRMTDNECEFGSHAWELSVCSHFNLFRRNRYFWRGASIINPSWLCAIKELGFGNTADEETIDGLGYNPTNGDFSVFRYDGADNTVRRTNVRVSYTGATYRAVYADVIQTQSKYTGSRNRWAGCRIANTVTRSGGGAAVNLEGVSNQLEAVSCIYGAGTSSPPANQISGSGNLLRDVEDVGLSSIRSMSFPAGTTGNRAIRCSMTVTNNSTGGQVANCGAGTAIVAHQQVPALW